MPFTITTEPEQLTEGLFGQVFLWVFEILPYLDSNDLKPAWDIRSLKYGVSPGYTIIPGLLDVNYPAPAPEKAPPRNLKDIRLDHTYNLGGDWHYANRIWKKYFSIPKRIMDRADSFGDLSNALGLHFRGTDKNLDLAQTNPVSREDFLALTDDFLANHPGVNTLFVASDEADFLDEVRQRHKNITVIETGKVDSWRDASDSANVRKGDHAILDCVLLSRCRHMIKCQSALSGFAKVLNPNLDAYRLSASKLYSFDIPYFPDAFVDRLESKDPKCAAILSRLLKDDWRDDRAAVKKHGKMFASVLREEKMRKNNPPVPKHLRPPVLVRARNKAERLLKKLAG